MKSETRNPWITKGSIKRFENPWIRVTEHSVINPAGKPGSYGTVHFKNLAIGIVPIDEKGNTFLVGQYRYPLKAYSWEIPEGGGKRHIPPLKTAKRELKEETGLVAKHWKKMVQMHLSNSVTDEFAIVYLATGLTQGEPHPEEDEKLRVKRVPLKKVYQWVIEGKITDSLTVVGVLRAYEILKPAIPFLDGRV